MLAALILATAVATAEPYALDAEATRAFIAHELPQIAEDHDDLYVVLLALVAALNDGPAARAEAYLRRIHQLAPADPVVLLHIDKYCRHLIADLPECGDADWPRRIAELDPENGAPWLRIAARAAERRDLDGISEALEQAAERPYYDGYFGLNTQRLYEALQRLAPSGRPLHAPTAAIHALGIAAAATDYEASLIPACREVADPRVAHLCRRVAHQLYDNGRSMISISAAVGVLQRLPDLTDQERRLIELRRREFERFLDSAESADNPWSTPARVEASMAILATEGERSLWARIADSRLQFQ